jgi:hypothetical protein
MTCRYASWLSAALAGDATERASQREVMGDAHLCQDARTVPYLEPTLIERLCRQRVLYAACLAPPISTYLVPTNQSREGGLHYSLPNYSFLLFQMTQARVFGGTVP